MEQNFDVFDFILTDDDMAEILKLDMGEANSSHMQTLKQLK